MHLEAFYLKDTFSSDLSSECQRTKLQIITMDNSKVTVVSSKKFGRSLLAMEPVFAGEMIASFDGACYSWNLSDEELPNEYPDFIRDHVIQFHPRRARDSKGFARYANHSCEPNCGIRNLFELVAMRDIPAGDEITWDYAMTEDDDWEFVCLCGAPTCRGIIRGFRYLSPELRQKYDGFLSEWLFQPLIGELIGKPKHKGLVPFSLGTHQILHSNHKASKTPNFATG